MDSPVEIIKSKLGIMDVIREFGGAELTQPKGNEYAGWHMAHDSQSKMSLKVNPAKDVYHCFNCGQRGDIFDWAGYSIYGERYTRQGEHFADVLGRLADVAGVELKQEDAQLAQERRGFQELLGEIATFYHEHLTDKHRSFLHERYGFNEETIANYQIGYAPVGGALHRHLAHQGYSRKSIVGTGLVMEWCGGLKDLFEGRYVVPYWRYGRPVYFIGRATLETPKWIDPDTGHRRDDPRKYLKQLVFGENHPEVSSFVRNDVLWGEDEVRSQDEIHITEGVMDCILANQEGFPCLSPVTVQFRRDDMGKLLKLCSEARKVYLANDSEESMAGHRGAMKTAEYLLQHGVVVQMVDLPRPPGRDKVDLNDFLKEQGAEAYRDLLPSARTIWDLHIDEYRQCKGLDKADASKQVFESLACVDDAHMLTALRARIPQQMGITKKEYDTLLSGAQRDRTRPENVDGRVDLPAERYAEHNGCLCEIRGQSEEGDVHYRPLCNFTAHIVADVKRSNGQDEARQLAIKGVLHNGIPLPEILVDAGEFERMSWPVEKWGGRVVVEPGKQVRDKLRHAIQSLSSDSIETRQVFTHTGWQLVDGERVFLTAAGGIGAANVHVEIDSQLHHYRLPTDEIDAEELQRALKASLEILDVAPDRVAYPLLAAMYTAPLSEIVEPDFVLWVEGRTGAGKSTLVALMLNHYGAGFHASGLPADWLGTKNSLEKLCFLAKDVPLVIDDFRPPSDPNEARQLTNAATRIVRHVGNRQGRSRMKADGSLRQSYPPRGLVISTAEEDALGQSTKARMMTVTIEPGDVDWDKMTACQEARGLLPAAMAGYIRYLIKRWDELTDRVPEKRDKMRRIVSADLAHARLPNAFAVLYTGFLVALDFFEEARALTPEEADEHRDRCYEALLEVAAFQSQRVAQEDPCLLFLQTVVDGLRSEKVRIRGVAGTETLGGTADGYDSNSVETIGQYDGERVYLYSSAYTYVHRQAQASGWKFPSSEAALRRQLADKGWLESTDKDRLTKTVRSPDEDKTVRTFAIGWKTLVQIAEGMGTRLESLLRDRTDPPV